MKMEVCPPSQCEGFQVEVEEKQQWPAQDDDGKKRAVVTKAELLHDRAFAFFCPGVVLLVGGVDQWVVFLVLFHVLPHSVKKTPVLL